MTSRQLVEKAFQHITDAYKQKCITVKSEKLKLSEVREFLDHLNQASAALQHVECRLRCDLNDNDQPNKTSSPVPPPSESP